MSLFNFPNKKQLSLFESQTDDQGVSAEENEPLDEEFTFGTKVKIVAALFIVGFAGYTAFWVQTPNEIVPTSSLKADVFMASSQDSTTSITTNQTGETQEVSIVDFNFDASTLHIQKGTTVTWTNKDGVPHNITAEAFMSDTLNPGESFSYTFTEDGIYDYHCSYHPQMKGSIVVGDAALVADAGDVEATGTAGTQNNLTTPTQILHGAATEQMSNAEAMGTTEVVTSQTTVATTGETPKPVLFEAVPQENNAAPEFQNSAPAPAPQELHGAAVEPLSVSAKKLVRATEFSNISNSGPEDYLYLGLFGVILFVNRKKVLNFR